MKNYFIKLSVFAFFYLFSVTVNAQGPCLVWGKGINASAGEYAYSTAIDASGNVYTVGYFAGTGDFDPGAGVFNMTSAGSNDVFISKLNAAGGFVWAKQVGGTSGDVATGIVLDALGNIYITGNFRLTVDFDPSASTYYLTSISSGVDDAFVLKLDAAGNFVWVKGIGAGGSEASNEICVDGASNIFITGYFQGVTDLDPGPALASYTSAGSNDAFVVKLNSSGSFIWAEVIGGAGADIGSSVKVDASGAAYVAGSFTGIVDFDPSASIYNLSSNGNTDAFIQKLDASGTLVWAKNFGSPSADVAKKIFVDPSGNLIVTGNFAGLTDFDPGPGTFTLTTSNSAYISKFDINGVFTWAKYLSGASTAQGVSVDAAGAIYTAGFFTSTVDFDPGASIVSLSAISAADAYIDKLDASGNYVWAKTFGATNNDGVYDIETDANGYVYFVGYYSSAIDIDPGPAVLTLPLVGSYQNNFIVKLGQAITPTITASGTTTFCAGGSVTLSSTAAPSYSWSNSSTTQSISASVSGNYYVIALNAGCSVYSNTIPVVVNPNPTITVNSGNICIGKSFTLSPSGASSYTFSSGTAVVSPTSNTSYTVTGASAFGCISQTAAVSVVNVNPLPIVTINTGSICSGNSFTLIPGGASIYTISGAAFIVSAGPSVVSPTTTSTYSVIGTSTAGCVSAYAVSQITVNPYPLPTITVNSGTLCSGNSFTLTPGGASTYTFSSGSSTVTPALTTTYSVTGTSSQGCISITPALSTVTVYLTPTIIVNSGNICYGNSYTINPSGANIYTISGGATVVSPTATTGYSVSGTSTAGCTSTNAAICNIIVNPIPTISATSGTVCSGQNFDLSPSGASSYTITGGSAIVSPTSNTSYTVSGTSIAGCASTLSAVANLTVLPTPAITTAGGIICAGQTFTIVALGSPTYAISGGNSVVSPSLTTSYSVSTTNTFGCTNIAVCTVTVRSLPYFFITSSDNVLCVGSTAFLTTGGSPGTFTWSNGSVAYSQYVTPITTTAYSLTGIDANGCVGTASYTQNIASCVGLENYTVSTLAIKVYPNPSNGIFNVELDGPATLTIYNSIGEIIHVQKSNTLLNTLSIGAFANGIYLLKIENEEKKAGWHKLIKAE